MTTQIHKFHTRDTEEQLYDVPLHDVELNDVANVRHKSASSCVPSWLHGNLAHYLMLFPRKAYKHQMPAWVWIRTLHGCPPHHVLTNLSLNMYHKHWTIFRKKGKSTLCVKIFDIGNPTLGLVLLSSLLKGHDSLAVGSNR